MAKHRNQTPADVDIEALQEIYLTFPEGYEVDHKMPISKGGLHYPSNLQHLPMPENRGNRVDVRRSWYDSTNVLGCHEPQDCHGRSF